MAQWLGFRAFTVEDPGQFPIQEKDPASPVHQGQKKEENKQKKKKINKKRKKSDF